MKQLLLFINTLLLSLSIVAVTSCQKDNDPDIPSSGSISFQAEISSRASETTFDQGDEISVTAYNSDGGTYSQNIRYTYSDGTFTSTTPITYPSDQQQLSFRAVYPYYEVSDDGALEFEVKTEQNQGTNYTLSDLMSSYVKETNSTTPNLVFSHLLTRVDINIVKTDISLDGAVASVSALGAVDYNIITNQASAKGESQAITMAANGINNYKVIIPAQNIEPGVAFGSIDVGGEIYNYVFEFGQNFISGKQYEFEMEIKSGKIEFISSSINDWEPGDTSTDNKNLLSVNIDTDSFEQITDIGSTQIGVYDKDGELLSSSTTGVPEASGLYTFDVNPTLVDRVIFISSKSLPTDLIKAKLSETLDQSIDGAGAEAKLFYQNSATASQIKGGYLSIVPKRGTATLDIHINSTQSIVIDSCVVTGLNPSTLVVGNTSSSLASNYTPQQFTIKEFGTLDDQRRYRDVLMMNESIDADVMAKLYVKLNGADLIMNVALPQTIVRNQCYTINISSQGAKLYTSLNVEAWGENSGYDVVPSDVVAVVDTERSTIPARTRLSSTRDTLYVEAGFSGDVILAIPSDQDLTYSVAGNEFQTQPINNGGLITDSFKLTFDEVGISKQRTISKLYIKSAAYPEFSDQHIAVVREPYRTRFSNFNGVSTSSDIVYDNYIDGTLAEISSDYTITSINTESTDSQFNWLRVDDGTEAGRYNLEGGFKPNDTEGTGQAQVSRLTVNYNDGMSEIFTFERKRWSVPVVYLGGRYWMKYNLRGTSNSYSDQISHSEDQPDLWNFLKTASDEDYKKYAGGHYKGLSRTPLEYGKDESGQPIFTDYDSYPARELYEESADYMTPPGYSLPTKTDIGDILSYSAVLKLKLDFDVDDRYSSNGGNRIVLTRSSRLVTFEDMEANSVFQIRIADNNNTDNYLVFFNLGTQSNSTTFNKYHTVIGTYSPGNRYHYFINHDPEILTMRYTAVYSAETRTLRAIKNEVAYIVAD